MYIINSAESIESLQLQFISPKHLKSKQNLKRDFVKCRFQVNPFKTWIAHFPYKFPAEYKQTLLS